ncbi:MAG: helix-turn-helix domain-containing protein [Terriglobia bacterium]
MAGHKPWREIRGKVSPARRAKIDALKRQYEKEMLLEQVREAREKTQQELARRMRTSQANISKLERRTDMLLSTLRAYIQAMGGDLELHAHFPGLGDVHLKGLGELRKGA